MPNFSDFLMILTCSLRENRNVFFCGKFQFAFRMGERKDNKLWQFDSDCRILSYYMGNDQVVSWVEENQVNSFVGLQILRVFRRFLLQTESFVTHFNWGMQEAHVCFDVLL